MADTFSFDDVAVNSSKGTKIPLMLCMVIALGLLGYEALQVASIDSGPSSMATSSATPFLMQQTLVVDVQGAVKKPGVQKHTMSFDGVVRIADILSQAGGVREDADSTYIAKHINQAAEVEDGYKLYIPKQGEVLGTSAGGGGAPSTGKVAINTASQSELETLKGIGKTRAELIISKRPYSSLKDFQTKTSFSHSLIQGIENEISF